MKNIELPAAELERLHAEMVRIRSFEDRVALDVSFNTERNLRIENSLARLEASGNLSLSGTLANPELSGTMNAKQDGTFQVGRNRFQLVSGRVDINGYPLDPLSVQVSALTRVGTTLIRLDADGDIDDLRTRLSAPEEQGLTEGDLMSLLKPRSVENYRNLSANLMTAGTGSGWPPKTAYLPDRLPLMDNRHTPMGPGCAGSLSRLNFKMPALARI